MRRIWGERSEKRSREKGKIILSYLKYLEI